MGINQTAQEAEIQRTAIYALDQVTGVFRACEVDVDGILQTTAGSGGGGAGGDVRIKDASAAQFASVDASGRLSVNVAGSVSVTGPLTDAQLRAAAVPVSGTLAVSNFPATQPISGTVSISGTVPVSGPLTDAQLRASAVPVSLASVPSHPVTGPLTDAQLRATPVPVSGTFWQATQPVSGPLTDTQLRAAAVTTDVSDRAARLLGVVSAGTNRIGSVRPVDSADVDLTAPKWTAPAGRYLAVHDAADMGRSLVCFGLGAAGGGTTTTAAAETLLTMSWSRDGGALASGTTYQVTAGKRLRILGVFFFERSGAGNTTATTARLTLRINTGGAVTAASPVQLSYIAAHPAAASTASSSPPFNFNAESGFELLAGWNFGVSAFSTGWAATTQAPSWDMTIIGFEY